MSKSLKDYSHLCGWVPPEVRTDEQNEADAKARGRMPRFAMFGHTGEALPEKVVMTDLWDSEEVQESLGFKYPGTHQVTGSCFPAGTPVRMKSGEEKLIEDIELGDEVVTHEGRCRKVVDLMNRCYTGEMYKIHAAGFAFPLEMTADHQVAVLPSRCNWAWQPGEIEWKRADELQEDDRVIIGYDRDGGHKQKSLDMADLLGGQVMILDHLMDYGFAPVNNIGMAQYVVRQSGIDWRGKVKLVKSRNTNAVFRHVPVGPSLGRLLGLYLAEGGCHEGRVTFTFARDEEDLVGETLALVRGLFGVEGEVVQTDSRPTVTGIRFNNNTLAAILKAMVPGNVYQKRVPGVLFHADEETKLAVLLGWMAGDGYAANHAKGIRIQGVTVNKGLARDMTTLAISCGIRATCSKRKARGCSKEAYDVYLSGKKILAAYPAMLEASKERRVYGNDSAATRYGYARRIKKIETRTVERLQVYDFEVEEDHSFIAGGLTVHNCVGAAGGDVLFTTLAAEVLVAKEAHKIIVPYWLLPYGKSRSRAGMRGKGEGSFGTTFADACRLDGVIDAAETGLPAYKQDQGLVWGRNAELAWSDGNAIDSKWLEMARHNIIGVTTVQESADNVKIALANWYPHTVATSHYCHPGQAKVKNGLVIGQFDTRGPHQTKILGYFQHPDMGDMFYNVNNWGNVYPKCPLTGRQDGCWIDKKQMNWAVSQREVIAFASMTGFMARTFKYKF